MLHCKYKLHLCCVWGWQPIALCGVVALAALAITYLLYEQLTFRSSILTSALVVALVVCYCFGLRSCTAFVLSGDIPIFPFAKNVPRNRQQLLNVAFQCDDDEESRFNRKKFSVVGSGWAYWLWRTSASKERIYMHRLTGLCKDYTTEADGQYFIFYAGTTIKRATEIMQMESYKIHPIERFIRGMCASKKEKLKSRTKGKSSFWSHPSYSAISLGSWFALGGHGNGAEAGEPSSKGLCFVEILNVEKRACFVYHDSKMQNPTCTFDVCSIRFKKVDDVYKEIRTTFDEKQNDGNIIILSLGFRKTNGNTLKEAKNKMREEGNTLSPNVLVQKKLCVLNIKSEDLDTQIMQWKNEQAVLRVLFLGSGRPYTALGIRWLEFDPDDTWSKHCRVCLPAYTEHVDEHDCSRDCRSMQADTCSVACGLFERNPNSWSGISTLSDANMFSPLYIPPIIGIAVTWAGFYNFEICCKLIDVTKIAELLKGLSTWHGGAKSPFKSGFGRTEIRGGSGGGEFVWIDFVLLRHSFCDAFKIVYKALKPTHLALHPGKYNGEELVDAHRRATNLDLCTLSKVFYGESLSSTWKQSILSAYEIQRY